MNPLEVTVRNFQVFDDNDGKGYHFNFRDHRLWAISGENGAGKSAIFDAMTYALFTRHRLGAQLDEELLRKGSDRFECTFIFEHNGNEFRIRRTLARRMVKGEAKFDRNGSIAWYDPAVETWRPVEGVTSARGVTDYVTGTLLGFGYDTFVASTLLIQGESDRLLRAKPEERFTHLSGILDLSRYKELAERAGRRSQALRIEANALAEAATRAAIPDPATVTAAEEIAAAATTAHAEAATADAAERARLARVHGYAELSGRRVQLATQIADLEEAQRDAPAIRAAAQRSRELGSVLPTLRTARDYLADAEAAEKREQLELAAAAAIDLEVLGQLVIAATAEHAAALADEAALAERLRTLREETRTLAPELQLAQRLATADAAVETASAEIALLEPQVSELAEVRCRKQRLDALSHGLSGIESIARTSQRLDGLRRACPAGSPQAAAIAAARAVTEAEAAVVDGRGAVTTATSQLAELRGRRQTAQATLEERLAAGAEGTCSHCGQPVSAGHIEQEIATCRAQVAGLDAEIKTAVAAEADRQAALDTLEATLDGLRTTAAEAGERRRTEQQWDDDLTVLCADGAVTRLPDGCRERVLGPLAGLLAELTTVQAELQGRAAVEDRFAVLCDADADLRSHRGLLERHTAAQAEILRSLSRERASVVSIRASEVGDEVEAAEGQEEAVRRRREEVALELEGARQRLADQTAERLGFSVEAQHQRELAVRHRGTAERVTAALDPRHLPPTEERIAELDAEVVALAGAEERLTLLETAERELAGLQGQLRETDAAIARVSAEDRIDVATAEAALAAATAALTEADQVRDSARQQADQLGERRRAGLELEEQAHQARVQHAVWERLARLLGRRGLQLHLMRRDLAEIEKRTNPLLARISSGGLQLHIECGAGRGGGEEIRFRCRDAGSSDEDLMVGNLSGGQRFRVAVALAAGIAMYAGLGGGLPSQIIDEGFGSLDETGRTEMIEAIRDMAEHFDRIILVSHTASFHDATLFPARYELRREQRRVVLTSTR